MGVGAGIFKMTNTTTKPVNLANLTEQKISLAEAYAQSASQDKLVDKEFEASLGDGLIDRCQLRVPMEASNHDS
jgi:hypothetical protein